ncbi:ribosome-associated translation inhibitor RaiA [Lichenihabitans sp. PAMC28606]|uniref:ribosome hibernation-promoting factor, HPF/YfiA family n=1 Tax=Lichenihabitans TaxID=2723776 RepID=UPI001038548C|nr:MULTISPECIES: ribosome-associated translation inhibitor RaiA [Lichenihabitans]UDL96309.1 ribosome-associated translation inhibitor RaiA [Lichenihabitans sp. PAMC28606]
MSLRVSGKNLQIGEALQEHARSKVAAVFDRYVESAINGHVTVEPEGSGYRCEMILHLDSGMTLHAEGRAQEPYASFDQANHRIETRLRRYKRRLKGRHSVVDEMPREPMIADYMIEAPDADEEEPQGFVPIVVAEGRAPFKTLSVAAAVTELDLLGAPVLVFRHSGNDNVNIVYRRADGHIGWIDPSSLSAAP